VADDILVSVKDGVAIVTLNRPKKRNAVHLQMWRRLEATFLDLAKETSVRAAILTGAGGNFCAGADISEFGDVRSDAESGRIYEDATEAATIAIRDFPLPTIAAVSGYGVGGGCGLALACDFRVGDPSTRMGIPAARLSIVYSALDCGLLYRAVGLAQAKRVLFSGRHFVVDQCLGMGLIDSAHEKDALVGALELAGEFVANAPLSLRGSKIVLEALAAHQVDEKRESILAVIDQAFESVDYKEGAKAFMEKRQPVFVGR
jgi:enoyl-CoA hydratase/carnithine racemase